MSLCQGVVCFADNKKFKQYDEGNLPDKKRSRETVSGPWKTVSVLILVPIFMSFISISLFCSGIDIVDMKIGTRISTETVFQRPATVSLDLFLFCPFQKQRVLQANCFIYALFHKTGNICGNEYVSNRGRQPCPPCRANEVQIEIIPIDQSTQHFWRSLWHSE